MVQPPAPAAAVGERLAEELARLLDAEEVVLVGRLLVRVGRRDHHVVDLELVVEEVEDLADRARRVVREEGGVGGHPEAALLGRADRGDRLVEDALALDRGVVALAQAVDVDRPGEVGAGGEVLELALHEDRVGAQVDEPLAGDEPPGDLVDLGMDSGSPPAIETIGAPDSSTAARAWSTGMRRRSTWSGCWILPQPEQARLHWNSGSSSTTRGNFSRRARRWRMR